MPQLLFTSSWVLQKAVCTRRRSQKYPLTHFTSFDFETTQIHEIWTDFGWKALCVLPLVFHLTQDDRLHQSPPQKNVETLEEKKNELQRQASRPLLGRKTNDIRGSRAFWFALEWSTDFPPVVLQVVLFFGFRVLVLVSGVFLMSQSQIRGCCTLLISAHSNNKTATQLERPCGEVCCLSSWSSPHCHGSISQNQLSVLF